MLIRRICAAAVVGLAMSVGVVGSSQADSNGWYPKGAYGSDAYHGKSFKRSNVRCDKERDICYDRYGLSYHATARYLGEREANRAYKKYGSQVFLFSPKRGVICDRRTDSCTRKNWVGNNDYNNYYGNSGDRSTQAREGFGAIGSNDDWRRRQQQQYWPYDDD